MPYKCHRQWGPEAKHTGPWGQRLLFCSSENWGEMKAEKKRPWFKQTPIALQPIRSILHRLQKSICGGILSDALAYWRMSWLLNVSTHISLLWLELQYSKAIKIDKQYPLDYHTNLIVKKLRLGKARKLAMIKETMVEPSREEYTNDEAFLLTRSKCKNVKDIP